MSDNDTVTIPVEGSGEKDMTTPETSEVLGDIDQDCAELILEGMMEGHEALLAETVANAETAHSIVRFSGARKFNREDPLEAASAEVILKKKI
jgi:hypothetical protein